MLLAILKQLRKFKFTSSPLLELVIYYLAGRKGGSRRLNVEDVVENNAESVLADKNVLIAIWDFGSRPYALGDILSHCLDTAIKAKLEHKDAVDFYVIADPSRPSSRKQPYISSENYEKYLYELLPIFNACPLIRNVHLIRDRNHFERLFISWQYHEISTFPSLNLYNEELNLQLPFQGKFERLNHYYQQHNTLPRLRELKGYSIIKDQLIFGFKTESIFVALHMRQRKKEQNSHAGGALYRDCDIATWLAFIKESFTTHPEVVFLVLGRIDEFPRELYQQKNVFILKNHGFSTQDDITAIQDVDLFMGGMSGPAMAAILSDTPYYIFQPTNCAEEAASYFDVAVGNEKLCFSNEDQYIKWQDPKAEDLTKCLEQFLLNKTKMTTINNLREKANVQP